MLQQSKKLSKRLLSLALAAFVVISMAGISSIPAKAADGAVSGGDTITENGTYTLKEGATGTITIGENLEVTIDGQSYDSETSSFSTAYTDLNLVVGDGSKLTINDLYVTVHEDANSIIDFAGDGELIISGKNLLDRPDGYGSNATIHVGPQSSVVFDGDGYLWGYKHAAGSFIGSNASEVCGNVTFNGGTWMLKASKTGALIGQDSTEAATGKITINGGTIYLKAVARGSLLGASAQGKAPDVEINGGQLEFVTDWSGAAIGSANVANAGTLTVNGGSIRTIVTPNAYGAWGITVDKSTGAVLTDVNITAAHDTAMLAFDASDYADAESIDVYFDGSEDPFYSGGLYEFCTNEIKNPDSPYANATMCNWLPNTAEYKLAADVERDGNGYPNANGSTLSGDNTLVFQVSKEDHTFTVNGVEYTASWDAENSSFSVSKAPVYNEDGFEETDGSYNPNAESYTVRTAANLAAIADAVNAGDGLAGKTVTLANDIDLESEDWTAIGNGSNSFAGTFDGAGYTISNLSIAAGSTGYAGLFGNNSGTVKDFTVTGQFGSEDAYLSVKGDCFAGAVAYNTGEVSGIIADVDMYLTGGDGYAVAGVVGRNAGGTVSQCGNEGSISCDITKSFYRTGGVVGHLQNGGTVTESYNHGRIEAWNYRNGCQGTGGIVGSIDTNGTVSYCYNTATVHNGLGDSGTGGKQGTGGIVGSINAGDVNNCYAVANVYGPGSAGVIIGKVGNGTYSNLYSLYTARAYQQYGTKTDDTTGIKYADGSDEEEDGTIRFGGAAIANSYNAGYTISTSKTMQEEDMTAAAFAATLGEKFAYVPDDYPVLAWEAEKAYEDALANGVTFDSYSMYTYRDEECIGKEDTSGCHMVIEATFEDALTLEDAGKVAKSLIAADDVSVRGLDPATTEVSLLDDNTLKIDAVVTFMPGGIMAYKGAVIKGLTSGGKTVYWPDEWRTVAPTGLNFVVLDVTVGTKSTPASTTIQILSPAQVRSMNHIAWTSNGNTLIDGTGTAQTTAAHHHEFYNFTNETSATFIANNAKSTLAELGYTVSADGDCVTITADKAKKGEYLGIYNYDDDFLQTYGLTLNDQIKGLPMPDVSSIAGADITVEDVVFTGETVTPDVRIELDGDTLEEGVDYSLIFADEERIEPGVYEVTIQGEGDYAGVVKKSFRILFTDVADPELFYFDAIYWMLDNEITTGYDDGTFRPLNNANRAAVVTFLWRMAGKPEATEKASFSDMTGNETFDAAISWAVEEGITSGYSDGTFRPWNSCNRAAIVTFLWRYAGKPEAAEAATFKDMTGNADFDAAISWAAEKGITTGWTDNTFRPWNNCNRLAIASFMYRLNDLQDDADK